MKALLIITLPVLVIAAIILIALRSPEPAAPPTQAPTRARAASEVAAPERTPVRESAPPSRPAVVASALEPATSDGGVGIEDESVPSEPHATIHKTEDK